MSDTPAPKLNPMTLTGEQIREQLRQAPHHLALKTHNVATQLAVAADAAMGGPSDLEDTDKTRRQVLGDSVIALAGIELGAKRVTVNARLLGDLKAIWDMLMIAATEGEPAADGTREADALAPDGTDLSEIETVDAEHVEPERVAAPATYLAVQAKYADPDGNPAAYLAVQAKYADPDGNPAPDTPYMWSAAVGEDSATGEADSEAAALEAGAAKIADLQAVRPSLSGLKLPPPAASEPADESAGAEQPTAPESPGEAGSEAANSLNGNGHA